MSQILTLMKTIELGNELQDELLKLLKDMKQYPKTEGFLLNHHVSKNDEEMDKCMQQMELLLEQLICFCGGCAANEIECRDLYDAYSFLFQMYEDNKNIKQEKELSYGSLELQKKLHKIYYKVSDKTQALSRKNES